ncbi:MAG: GNAT family N-acetyltransferase [Thermoleophilaceae bacterium]
MPRLLPLDAALADDVVALREWRASDAGALVLALNDPDIARWTRVPSPYTREDAEEFLAQREVRLAQGEALTLAIASAASDEPLGSIALKVTSPENARGELGYLVFPAARGRGLGPRAVRLLARHAFEEAGLQRVEILTATGNAASQRVAEKAGFTREGLLRSYFDGRGQRDDMVIWSLLPGEL